MSGLDAEQIRTFADPPICSACLGEALSACARWRYRKPHPPPRGCWCAEWGVKRPVDGAEWRLTGFWVTIRARCEHSEPSRLNFNLLSMSDQKACHPRGRRTADGVVGTRWGVPARPGKGLPVRLGSATRYPAPGRRLDIRVTGEIGNL